MLQPHCSVLSERLAPDTLMLGVTGSGDSLLPTSPSPPVWPAIGMTLGETRGQASPGLSLVALVAPNIRGRQYTVTNWNILEGTRPNGMLEELSLLVCVDTALTVKAV